MLLLHLIAMCGCTWISPAHLDERMDLDDDGIPRPTDCDDDDPAVGQPVKSWVDLDGDGWGSAAELLECEPTGAADQTGDCDDENPAVFPDAEELCNAIDDDCDDRVDEGLEVPTWYLDGDGDLYGNPDEPLQACEAPESYVANSADCDDQDDSVNPDTPWYLDADEDGYGDPLELERSCTALSGRVRNDQDCDDSEPDIHPEATEVCDEEDLDEDCDGLADDQDDSVSGVFDLFYSDGDGDGLGEPGTTMERCDASDAWSANGRDCDDEDATVGDCGWLRVSAGNSQTCGVRGSGALECWGTEEIASQAPEGSFVDVDLGSNGGCALGTDGQVVCFNTSSYYVYAGTYSGPYLDVCAAYGHFCTLDMDGLLECRGSYSSAYAGAPVGEVFVSVACDDYLGCALAADGRASCWGESHTHAGYDLDPSAEAWVELTAAQSHACGLTTDGAVECSGEEYSGSFQLGAGPYRSIGAGTGCTYAIDQDDSLEHWGYSTGGVNSVPSGRFESVDGGRFHACAVSETGELVCWGCQGGWDLGQCTVPDTDP